jgi:lysozyme
MDKLCESIKRHEGNPGVVYLDSEGFLTCGWGHKLQVNTKVPLDAAEAFLAQDIADAVNDFCRLAPVFGQETMNKLNDVRRRVITEMLFNLGFSKVLGFKKFWQAVKQGDWIRAGAEMLDSKWHKQVGKRAEELARLFEMGSE